jgi:hypothetical protein
VPLCGSCVDCRKENKAKIAAEEAKPRDPSITYGLGYRTKRKPVPGRKIHEIVHYGDGRFRIPSLRLTGERFHRHAERFGPDMVKVTAEMHGIDLRVKTQTGRPKRRRRTSEELRREVAELRGRGMVPAAIADTLNVADRRVGAIFRELDAVAA